MKFSHNKLTQSSKSIGEKRFWVAATVWLNKTCSFKFTAKSWTPFKDCLGSNGTLYKRALWSRIACLSCWNWDKTFGVAFWSSLIDETEVFGDNFKNCVSVEEQLKFPRRFWRRSSKKDGINWLFHSGIY